MPSLPWTLVKAFVKLQCDIVDRFDSGRELLLYVCLLCVMDREGRIRLDYDTLAARIRWKLDAVQDTMQLLMRPNPASKCKKHNGACVTFLDPERPSLGFLIPAAVSHRKRNVKSEARKLQQRTWARNKRKEKRRHASTRVDKTSTPCRLPPPSMSTNVDSASTRVDTKSTAIEIEKESIIRKSHVANTLPDTPNSSKPPGDPDLIHDVDQVLTLLIEKVYDNRLRKNQVGQETLRLISSMLPFSREQIEMVADYYTLPPDDCWPELKKRRLLGFDQLLRYWVDQVSIAVQFDQKYFAR